MPDPNGHNPETALALGDRAVSDVARLSVQSRATGDSSYLPVLFWLASQADEIPAYWSPARDLALRAFWKTEPILAGAVGSMVSKLKTLGWTLDGPNRQVSRFQRVLSEAEFGQGWGHLISKVVEDLLTADKGAFIELLRADANGPVLGLAHLDSARCGLTGDMEYPVVYMPIGGRPAKLAAHQVIHLVSHPSPDEALKDCGFCAVSRCLKAAQIMRDIHLYKSEKLSSAPNRGLVIVQGITQKRLEAAFAEAEEAQKNQGLTRFAKVVMLATQDAGTPLNVSQLDFASLPDGYNEETSITLYAYILALAFGVDAREFWPATASGATKADAEVQAQKARGKGVGDILTTIERQLNWKVLPDSLTFRFDFQDDEEDRARADLEGKRIESINRLYAAPQGLTEGLITRAEGRQLLADAKILPQEMLAAEGDITPDVTADDVEQQETAAEQQAQQLQAAATEETPEAAKAVRIAERSGDDELQRLFGSPVRYAWPEGRTVSRESKRPFALGRKAAEPKLVDVPLPDDVDDITLALEGKFTTAALGGLQRIEKAVVARLRQIAQEPPLPSQPAMLGKALVALGSKEEQAPIVDDDDFWREMDLWLLEALQAIVTETTQAGAQSAASAVLKAVAVGVDMALVNEPVLEWSRHYTYDLVSGLNQTTRNALREAITTWQSQGLGTQGLPDLIRALEPTFGKTRAELVGATEVTRCFSEGSRLAYGEVPGGQGLRWKTSQDERVCNVCGPLHNTWIEFDEDFRKNLPADVRDTVKQGFRFPPSHPRCRCRVVLVLGAWAD